MRTYNFRFRKGYLRDCNSVQKVYCHSALLMLCKQKQQAVGADSLRRADCLGWADGLHVKRIEHSYCQSKWMSVCGWLCPQLLRLNISKTKGDSGLFLIGSI